MAFFDTAYDLWKKQVGFYHYLSYINTHLCLKVPFKSRGAKLTNVKMSMAKRFFMMADWLVQPNKFRSSKNHVTQHYIFNIVLGYIVL